MPVRSTRKTENLCGKLVLEDINQLQSSSFSVGSGKNSKKAPLSG